MFIAIWSTKDEVDQNCAQGTGCRAEGALRISATTPVGPARLSVTDVWIYVRFHARAVILQTYVEVPDRPSNRGALRGGPETLENLVRVGVLCPGGTQPGA